MVVDDDCKGIFGFLFGHKFRPRYHEEQQASSTPLPDDLMMELGADDASMLIEAMRSYKQTYVGDVCVRCGKVVNNDQKRT